MITVAMFALGVGLGCYTAKWAAVARKQLGRVQWVELDRADGSKGWAITVS